MLLCASAVLGLLLTGCRHPNPVPSPPISAKAPTLLLKPPPVPHLPPMPTPLPASILEIPSTVTVRLRPHRRIPPPPVVVAPALAPPPPVAEPPASLGTLSAGGNSTAQQQVADRILAIEHRLSDLPAALVEQQKKQVGEVRLFLNQALEALKTGDAEGAGNLATKAGLLLDDIRR